MLPGWTVNAPMLSETSGGVVQPAETGKVSVSGEKVEIPINDGSVLKLWNMPRSDRNNYDHSGPAKIAITVSADGDTDQYILPVQMQATMQHNTIFRQIVGSRTFYDRD